MCGSMNGHAGLSIGGDDKEVNEVGGKEVDVRVKLRMRSLTF